jgi:hypothetical protein
LKRLRVTLTRDEVCRAMDALESVIEYYEDNEGWGNIPREYVDLREKLRGLLQDFDLRGKRAA